MQLPSVLERQRLVNDGRFYLIMAIAAVILIFAGFSRTYYLKFLFPTSPALSLLIHVHAFVFTAWMFYFIIQTALIAVNRSSLHRTLGIAGAFLGSSMIALGLAALFTGLQHHRAGGAFDPETIFLLGLGDLAAFSLFFILGFLFRRDYEAHQRLMLLAVVTGLAGPAVGRLGFMGVATPLLTLISFSFLLAGPAYDFATRRRIHYVYVYGCIFAIVTAPPLRVAVASTAWWHNVAHVIVGMPGTFLKT